MKNRDHFACAAMQALISSCRVVEKNRSDPTDPESGKEENHVRPDWNAIYDRDTDATSIAISAYRIADAMLIQKEMYDKADEKNGVYPWKR